MSLEVKRISHLLSFFILIVVGLVGCSNATTVIHEVNLQEPNKDAKTFVDRIKDSNGLYLYSVVGKQQYLIVNYSSVLQGEEAKFLDSITAEVLDQTLSIHIEELGTHDYNDKRLGKLSIFNLSSVQEYEYILIFKNGEKTVFDLVGG